MELILGKGEKYLHLVKESLGLCNLIKRKINLNHWIKKLLSNINHNK